MIDFGPLKNSWKKARKLTGNTRLQLVFSIKTINNGSAYSVLFLSTRGLFPVRRNILERETQSSVLTFSLSAGNNPEVLKNSPEHAEPSLSKQNLTKLVTSFLWLENSIDQAV